MPHADGRIGVGWAPERTLPVGDPTCRDLYLSLGAAVESARLRALVEGAALTFEPAPPDAQDTVGWLVPDARTGAPDPADLRLAAALDRRQTVRKPHLPRAVPASLRGALIAEAARYDRRLYIAADRPTVRRLAALAGRATAALFADGAVHAELWRWLRLDPADPTYQRDGLTADCLELFGPTRWLAQQTMPPARMRWLSRVGLHQLFASDTARVARKSAAICLLTTPVWDRASLVETGRVLQRLWLLAAQAGLTTHPLSALLDCSETAGSTARAFGLRDGPHPQPLRCAARTSAAPTSLCAGEGSNVRLPGFLPLSHGRERGPGGEGYPAAVFRLGFAPPAARSARLPLDVIVKPSPEL